MREDPLGLAGGDANTLRYAGNAATMYSDPSGMQWGEEHLGRAWAGFAEVPRLAWDLGATLGAAGYGSATGNWATPAYHSMTVNSFLGATAGGGYDSRYFDGRAAGQTLAAPVTFAWDLG